MQLLYNKLVVAVGKEICDALRNYGSDPVKRFNFIESSVGNPLEVAKFTRNEFGSARTKVLDAQTDKNVRKGAQTRLIN